MNHTKKTDRDPSRYDDQLRNGSREQETTRARFWHFMHYNAWIIILDLLSFNLSYLLTLYIRFRVNNIYGINKNQIVQGIMLLAA